MLKPTGILVSLPGPIPESEEAAHGKRRGRRGVFFIVHPDREQLGKIAALIDSGAIRPVIAETIPLAKARQAFERGVVGHTRGTLVLAVVYTLHAGDPKARSKEEWKSQHHETP